MWTNIERGIDGMVGRMMSWLTHPPAHPSTLEEMEDGAEHLAETVGEGLAGAAREVVETVAETAREVADAVAETAEKIADAVGDEAEETAEAEAASEAERHAEALIENDLEPAAVEPDAGELGEPEKELLATFEPESGLSMKQLQQATGDSPYATRQRLNRLIQAGKVQRRGKGMRTRYHLTES